MSKFRLDKNTTERYTSLSDLASAWGCRPVSKQTKDQKKLNEQREKFCARHKCKACGQPMTYSPVNMMVCTNEKCKGIKVEREDKERNVIISYVPSFDLLDDHASEIAQNIFA